MVRNANLYYNVQKATKTVLLNDNNRLILSACIVVCISATMLFCWVADLIIIFIDMLHLLNSITVYSIYYALICIFLIFLVLPLYISTYYISFRMCKKEKTSLIDIFDCFSSGTNYIKSLKLTFKLFFRILPFLLITAFIFIFKLPSLNVAAICVCVLFTLNAIHSFGAISFALMSNDNTRMCKKKLKISKKGNYTKIYRLAFSTFIKLVLSLFTIGIVTVVHTIPTALLNYANMAINLNDNLPKGQI